jgi:hypothetical protein
MAGPVPAIHVFQAKNDVDIRHRRQFTPSAQGRLLRPGMTNETPKLALERGLLMLALEPADMLLGVKFEPDPPDQIKLGFEEVDVMLLVLHQAFE